MVIIPQSDVILLKCPLELSQDNQLNFANATAQYNYFYGLNKLIVSNNDYSYVRKDGMLRVAAGYDSLIEYNYVMYKNDAYSNKWFYAFIESMEYINDGMTAIKISTDVFQTWQFDLTYKRTFVEREHVNDDTIGKHTLPESLDLGEFEIVDLRNIPMHETETPSTDWLVCFCVTALPEGCVGAVDGRVNGDTGYVGGVFNSLKFFCTHTLTAAKYVINKYDTGSVTSDAIVNIYMVPSACVNESISSPTTLDGHVLAPLYNYAYSDEYFLQQPATLAENYTPVNKKLYTAPFSYIYMSNNVGEDVTLDWQDFPITTISGNTAPTISYYKYYVPSASISAKMILTNYKNYASDSTPATQMTNYGITFGKVPVCAWTTDYYTNWLTQNGVNTQASYISAGLTAFGSLGLATLTGGLAGVGLVTHGLTSGMQQVTNAVAEEHKAQTTPPQAHGDISTGDMVYALKRNSISCYFMSVRKEVAQVIDGYFSMYGYKVNSVKVPNITGRQNWNYVKTIDCYIQADIPQEDLQTIKSMFDRGLTIWHHASTFMDYSQSNAIVS